jgi:hypothetical protein
MRTKLTPTASDHAILVSHLAVAPQRQPKRFEAKDTLEKAGRAIGDLSDFDEIGWILNQGK